MPDLRMVGQMLGGRKVLGREIKSTVDLVEVMTRGLPYASLDAISKRVGLTTLHEKSEALGVPERTLQRRADKGKLDPYESERTVRLARIAQRAEEVLEDMGKAYQWLREPNQALGGKRPLELIHTDVGTQMVEEVLGRIEYTVYG
ncbi:MAG TPA: antitoxin Xre/MbcA/ParS toxin-binding domain-containing protein [Myxococcales bacterium]|nr:antitoxin Xre/MbcA/ParS toxin-binding domain-containing protein [Myxococcales bacterium]